MWRSRGIVNNMSRAVYQSLMEKGSEDWIVQNLRTSFGDLYISNYRASRQLASLLFGNEPSILSESDDKNAMGGTTPPHSRKWIRMIVSLLSKFSESSECVESSSCDGVQNDFHLCFTPVEDSHRFIVNLRCILIPSTIMVLDESKSLKPSPQVRGEEAHNSSMNTFSAKESALNHIRCVQERENNFACQLIQLIGLLEEWYRSPSTTVKRELLVPIYQVRVQIEDTASTRISSILPYTNLIIESVVEKQHSVCKTTTRLLQCLVHLSTLKVFQLFPLPCDATTCEDADIYYVSLVLKLLQTSGLCESSAMQLYFPLPSVLVHCLVGASRSPSIVLGFMMSKWADALYAERKEESDCGECSTGKISFQDLIEIFQKERPAVRLNLCFAAELKSMWNRVESPAR